MCCVSNRKFGSGELENTSNQNQKQKSPNERKTFNMLTTFYESTFISTQKKISQNDICNCNSPAAFLYHCEKCERSLYIIINFANMSQVKQASWIKCTESVHGSSNDVAKENKHKTNASTFDGINIILLSDFTFSPFFLWYVRQQKHFFSSLHRWLFAISIHSDDSLYSCIHSLSKCNLTFNGLQVVSKLSLAWFWQTCWAFFSFQSPHSIIIISSTNLKVPLDKKKYQRK